MSSTRTPSLNNNENPSHNPTNPSTENSPLSLADFSGKDYYQMLNVERTASLMQIQTAYRRLALTYHPDKHRNADIFILLNTACATLSDQQKKYIYDRKINNKPPMKTFSVVVKRDYSSITDELLSSLHGIEDSTRLISKLLDNTAPFIKTSLQTHDVLYLIGNPIPYIDDEGQPRYHFTDAELLHSIPKSGNVKLLRSEVEAEQYSAANQAPHFTKSPRIKVKVQQPTPATFSKWKIADTQYLSLYTDASVTHLQVLSVRLTVPKAVPPTRLALTYSGQSNSRYSLWRPLLVGAAGALAVASVYSMAHKPCNY